MPAPTILPILSGQVIYFDGEAETTGPRRDAAVAPWTKVHAEDHGIRERPQAGRVSIPGMPRLFACIYGTQTAGSLVLSSGVDNPAGQS